MPLTLSPSLKSLVHNASAKYFNPHQARLLQVFAAEAAEAAETEEAENRIKSTHA